MSVLLGSGDGGFATGAVYGVVSDPWAVVVGDFNDDGKPDLAVASYDNAVSVLLNQGDGTFGTEITFAVGNAVSLAAGDLNGDGLLDLAVPDFVAGKVSLLLNSCSP